MLLAAASLMLATGVAFAAVHDYALLVVVAFAGTINPSAGSVSVFVLLEHAALAGHVAAGGRTTLFARYRGEARRPWPLLICGALKIIYDLLLLVQFRSVKPPEER